MNILEKILEELEELKKHKPEAKDDIERIIVEGAIGGVIMAETIIRSHLGEVTVAKSESTASCWIPTSERLPEDIEYMLVTVSGEYGWRKFENAVMIGDYDFRSNDWVIEGLEEWKNPNVTAWQPLPQSYQGE